MQTTQELDRIARLITRAAEVFNETEAAAACGCNLPHGYDLTETREKYLKLANEFGLPATSINTVVAGQCSSGIIECLTRDCGFGYNVWVKDGAIVLHHVPEDHPIYAMLRSLTSKEVCNSRVMEERKNARK